MSDVIGVLIILLIAVMFLAADIRMDKILCRNYPELYGKDCSEDC